MISKTKLLAATLAVAVSAGGLVLSACSNEPQRTERWATTENTNVQINWDKVNQA